MTQTTDLAQALDQERRRQGLSLTELIQRSGLSRAAVYRLFKGGDVQLTTLLAVSNLLGLSLLPVRSDLAPFLAGPASAGSAAVLPTVPSSPSSPSGSQATGLAAAAPLISVGEPPAAAGPVSALHQRAGVLQQRLATTGVGTGAGHLAPRRGRGA